METTSSSITRPAYPSLKQGWILLAVMIGSQIIVGILLGFPIIYAKENGINTYGFLELLAYAGSMGLVIWYALKERRSNALAWNPVAIRLYPVLFIGTIALAILLEPIISAVPSPDWLEKLLKEAMTKT